jgi:1,4-alpha-glucan branching enzyme
MKVIIVSPVFPYPKKGVYVGIERHVYEYTQALLRKGIEVHVVTTFWNGGEAEDEFEGIKIHRASDLSMRFGKLGCLFNLNTITFGRNILKFEKLFKSSDVVHTHIALSSMNFFIKNNLPVVSHFHHRDELEKPSDYLYKPIHFWLEKKSYSGSDAVVTVSKSSKEILVNRYDVSRELIKVVPNGVDASVFNPQNISKKLNERFKANKTLLFVGPLIKRKGLAYLINAMPEVVSKYKEVLLLIIGDGAEKNHLMALTKKLNIEDNVVFEGFVAEDSLPHYYNAADIFVFPSLVEGFGMVLTEAMACGLPVISTNTSAIPEVVGDAGILVEPGNSQALAETITKLLKDKELRKELEERSRKRVEGHFTWDRVADQTIEVYEEIIGAKKK